MKRSIIAALLAATAVFGLSGCGAGRQAQTAEMVPPVPGINQEFSVPDGGGTVGMRNVALAYPGPEGYKAGSEATARFWFFNNTRDTVTVVVTHNGQSIHRGDIPAMGFDRPEVRFTLASDVKNHQRVPMEFEFVGIVRQSREIPVMPPQAPGPAEKVEFPESPAGEGH